MYFGGNGATFVERDDLWDFFTWPKHRQYLS